MSRRQPPAEQEFGSDSFLDVIANIVGILIILIVIAGLKVARQPTEPGSGRATTAAMIPSVAPASASPAAVRTRDNRIVVRHAAICELLDTDADLELSLRQLADEEAEVLRETEQLSGDKEILLLQAAARRQDAEQVSRQDSQLKIEQQQLARSTEKLEQQLADLTGESEAVLRVLADTTSEQTQSEESLRRMLTETQQLQESLAALQDVAAADRLQHRLSPVSERVEEGELHFRVEGGRVSHVPLQELLERLKSQVQSRRSAVTRFTRYEGVVGPVNGYRMSYVVERDTMSQLESLQYGIGGYRIAVSRWTVTPDVSLESELVEDAVRRGSRFRQLVETAPPDSAATFWIYPDSFAAYASLRDLAHGLQLRVAARPLPPGTPIIGSPGGSRSNAQ